MNEENNNVQRDNLVYTNNFNENNNSKSKKNSNKFKIRSIIMVILLIIVIGMIILIVLSKVTTIDQNKIKKYDIVKVNNMFEYSGTYKSGDTIVTMNVVDENHVAININKKEVYYTTNLMLDKNNALIPDDKNFSVNDSLKIEKTEKGILITSSSKNKESMLNNISGELKKEKINTTSWTGIYTNNDTKIIIDQYDSNRVVLNIIQGELNYETEVYNITDTKLTVENVRFMTNENITIEKKSNSIVVESKSGDPDSILNKINGEYSKIK